MELAELEKKAKRLRCTCGGELVIPIIGGEYQLKCRRDKSHTDWVKRVDPVVERFEAMRGRVATDEVIDLEIEEYKNKERERRNMKELTDGNRQTALEQYRGRATLSKADALEILHLIYPKVPEGELVKAALTCATYKLNPLAKHLYILPFTSRQGETTWAQVWGINATRLIARRAAMFYRAPYGYADFSPRIMTEDEEVKINGRVDSEQIWAITILEDGRGLKTYGVGAWPKQKVPYGADKGNTPENMARIRSERNALDKLFPGEMAQEFEVIHEADVEEALEEPQLPTASEQHLSGDSDSEEGQDSATPISPSFPTTFTISTTDFMIDGQKFTKGQIRAVIYKWLVGQGKRKPPEISGLFKTAFPHWGETKGSLVNLSNAQLAEILTYMASQKEKEGG